MNDRTQKTDKQDSNPLAASVRLKARSMTRAYGQRRHDFRVGTQPDYVDGARTHLNRVLMQPRRLPEIRKEIEALRRSNGARRAMKSNAAVVTAGIVTFGHKAAELFSGLQAEEQDSAFRELVEAVAGRLGTRAEALVVHLDETSPHAHFELRAYTEAGIPISQVATQRVMSELQDMTAEIMSARCPGIERGNKKYDRIKAGADYSETLNRSVKQLHHDLPAEIAQKQDQLKTIEAEIAELEQSKAKTKAYREKLLLKEQLTEKEAKRLKTYEARLQKKEVEQAEIRLRQMALLEKLEAEKAALSAQKADVLRREAHVNEQRQSTAAAMEAVESVVEELEAGTLNRGSDGKLRMRDATAVKAATSGVVKRLLRAAMRLVDLRDRTQRKEALLSRLVDRLARFLKREDLTEDARAEAEGFRDEVGDEPEL